MLVLTILLAVTNAATLGALWWLWKRHSTAPTHPDDHDVNAALAAQPPAGAAGRTRRVISVEILNPIELAGTRGRMAGIAGSLAPELTRRIVYDRTIRTLRHQLVEQQVVAHVQLHTLRPQREERRAAAAVRVEPQPEFVDEVEEVDVDLDVPDDQPAQ